MLPLLFRSRRAGPVGTGEAAQCGRCPGGQAGQTCMILGNCRTRFHERTAIVPFARRSAGMRHLELCATIHSTLSVSRSEEHTSELQSLMRISYAVFCLKKKNTTNRTSNHKH